MKTKLLTILISSLFILSSCASSDPQVDFLNSKNVGIFTYKTNYESLKELNSYTSFSKVEDFDSLSFDYYFIYFDGSQEEQNDLSNFFIDEIVNAITSDNLILSFYNYDNLIFLKDSELDYEPRDDDYSVETGHMISFKRNHSIYGTFFDVEDKVFVEYDSFISFTSNVILNTYNEVYEDYSIQWWIRS